MSSHEREKLVRGLLVIGIGLGLAFGVCLITLVIVASKDNSPSETFPTPIFTAREKMEESAYNACAEQFVPPPAGYTFFPIEAWSIVPWPKNGYYRGKPNLASSKHLPAVSKEDNLYHVKLFVDFTEVVTEKEPYTEKVTTTRIYGREMLNCFAYYLGTENGIARWDVEFLDSLTGNGDCIHSKYMDPILSSYVFCDYY